MTAGFEGLVLISRLINLITRTVLETIDQFKKHWAEQQAFWYRRGRMKEPSVSSQEEQRLAALRELGILDTEPEERFDAATRILSRFLNVPIALVSLVDEHRQWFKSSVGLDVTETPRAISFCGHAIQSEDLFVVPDALSDARFQDNPLVTGTPHIRSYAGCPIKTRSGHLVGTLCAIDDRTRTFSQAELDLLQDLGTIVSLALESSEATIRARQILIDSLRERDTKRELLLHRMSEIAQIGGWRFDLVTDELTWTEQTCRLHGVPDDYQPDVKSALNFYLPEDRVAVTDAVNRAINERTGYDLEVRIRRTDGQILWARTMGEVDVVNGEAVALFGFFQDVTKTRSQLDSIHQLAFYDALTDLPNRRAIFQELDEAIQESETEGVCIGVILLDLDDFKLINDAMGHRAGDAVLREIAQRLRKRANGNFIVSRIGGDEFLIVVRTHASDDQQATESIRQVLPELIADVAQPLIVFDSVRTVSASAGAAIISSPTNNAIDLIRYADIAMYAAKEQGKNCFSVFDEQMYQDLASKDQLIEDLKSAISREEGLEVWYQPQFNRHHRLVGVEALARWNHPTLGRVPPDKFIDLAESINVMYELGEIILRQACTDLSSLSGELISDVKLAVNISQAQLAQNQFPALISKTLTETALPPNQLVLEITESMVARDIDKGVQQLNHLRKEGVSVSLDDFGTGYSSLFYLRKLPIDELKIDRTFLEDIVANEESQAIIKAIAALAESLNLSVIAEGVETIEQIETLKSLNCHNYQGFYFARPMPLEQLEAFLKRTHTSHREGEPVDEVIGTNTSASERQS